MSFLCLLTSVSQAHLHISSRDTSQNKKTRSVSASVSLHKVTRIKFHVTAKIISPACGCLSIDVQYSCLHFWLSCGKKSPPPCMSGSATASLFAFKLVSYQRTGNGVSEVQHGRAHLIDKLIAFL